MTGQNRIDAVIAAKRRDFGIVVGIVSMNRNDDDVDQLDCPQIMRPVRRLINDV